MKEKRFADLTVQLWRLGQRITRLRRAARLGVPKAITVQAVQETKKRITNTLTQLQHALGA